LNEFDFIVVGAGSAGCALVEGLSKNGRHRIALIEAGGSDRNFWVKMPIGYGRTFYDARLNWMYETEPDPNTGMRKSYWPRGKILGGSSSINALIYVRGFPSDFNRWVDAGATGWDWDTVRSCYESFESPINADGTRIKDGYLSITDTRKQIHVANRHYFEMARELGLPVSDDLNGLSCEGISHYAITTSHGMRCSSADAFLRPALRRRNVTLISHSEVSRILFNGRQAIGIELVNNMHQHQNLRADKEVIICAGSIASPKLLQLSGIGPGDLLKTHGIEPLVANPNVGANLQDHIGINYYYKANEPTLNNALSPWWGKLIQGARYLFTQTGPLSLSVNQCGGFLKSDNSLEIPDQQVYLNPVTYTTVPAGTRTVVNPDPFAGFILSYQPCRPDSRGFIHISSADPGAPPRITPNYLATQHDEANVIAGGRLIQRMAASNAIQKFAKEAIEPDILNLDDDGLLEDFRQRCGTVFHPTSTCRMGQNANVAVVDHSLKVYGTDSLRIADASVFPCITSGNTNAPSIMVGRRAAELITAEYV
jgi:choline dehydrogenase